MGFHWGVDLPGDGSLLTHIPQPFSHLADWLRARGWLR